MDSKKIVVIIICFLIFIAITVHHFIVCGRLFDLSDMLHHEFFSAIFLALGIGIILGDRIE